MRFKASNGRWGNAIQQGTAGLGLDGTIILALLQAAIGTAADIPIRPWETYVNSMSIFGQLTTKCWTDKLETMASASHTKSNQRISISINTSQHGTRVSICLLC